MKADKDAVAAIKSASGNMKTAQEAKAPPAGAADGAAAAAAANAEATKAKAEAEAAKKEAA